MDEFIIVAVQRMVYSMSILPKVSVKREGAMECDKVSAVEDIGQMS